MSVSKWAYDPKVCEGQKCQGDCDFCRLWLDREDEEEESRYEQEMEEERKNYV